MYKYQPQTKKELIGAIKKEIYEVQGNIDNPNWEVDLNCIDTSFITDMSWLFSEDTGLEKFNGDISRWNVSNVVDMSGMFAGSPFNQDISSWDVRNVENMEEMFYKSAFNQDISKWNIDNVIYMSFMFTHSPFNQDISGWGDSLSNIEFKQDMLKDTPLGERLQEQKINNEDIDNDDEVEFGR